MIVRSDLCVEHWLLSHSSCIQKYHWIITINGKRNVWKCKFIFPTDNNTKTDRNNWYKTLFVGGENTNGLRFCTIVYIYIYIRVISHMSLMAQVFMAQKHSWFPCVIFADYDLCSSREFYSSQTHVVKIPQGITDLLGLLGLQRSI